MEFDPSTKIIPLRKQQKSKSCKNKIMAKVFRRGVTWILVAPVKAVLENAATALQSYTGQLKIQGWPGLTCVPDQSGLLSETGKKVKGREHKSYPH